MYSEINVRGKFIFISENKIITRQYISHLTESTCFFFFNLSLFFHQVVFS